MLTQNVHQKVSDIQYQTYYFLNLNYLHCAHQIHQEYSNHLIEHVTHKKNWMTPMFWVMCN